jgi:hypothetical protein
VTYDFRESSPGTRIRSRRIGAHGSVGCPAPADAEVGRFTLSGRPTS